MSSFPASSYLAPDLGQQAYRLIERLYPLNRSITGDGVRRTLDEIAKNISIDITEVPTGTQVFDWEIPQEWNIRDAYIKDSKGKKVVDFSASNLHVVGYSEPVHQTMSSVELQKHLHSLPDRPDWIPYRTSYYKKTWGFCLAERVRSEMVEKEYEVHIDSHFSTGALTYAELHLPGKLPEEILFFAHTCHPSLCNDNLSGIAVMTLLARELSRLTTKFSYRFVFAPATIGSITWLARNEHSLSRIRGGLVIASIGDSGALTYKRSRRGISDVDRAATYIVSSSAGSTAIEEFSPWGYDERQFCSPGINLAMGRLTRTPNGRYPQYHTSADDLGFINESSLQNSAEAIWDVIEILEEDRIYLNNSPKGEPQLGRRGLYRSMGGYQDIESRQHALLWLLNMADGKHSLLDIAELSRLPFGLLRSASQDLLEVGLIEEVAVDGARLSSRVTE